MGRYIVELTHSLPAFDPQNTYYIYVSKKNKSYFTLSEKNIVVKTISSFWCFLFFKIIWEQFFLPFSLWKNNVQLYHGTGFTLPFFKSKKMRYVVTIADMTFFSHPKYHTWWKVFYFQHMIPPTLKKADIVIAISENTKSDVMKMIKISPEKIKSIYLGVDEKFLPQQEKEYKEILKKYSIPKPYILFVGMLEPRKNLDGLLRAYAPLKERLNHHLIIVGKKGWKYEPIFETVKKLELQNHVHFLGYVPDEDVPALYSAATCFVYPSFYEGFGIPIIEAMACGCPVITSNNSSMKEIAGNAAILVDPYNITDIQNAIELLIADKAIRIKKRKEGIIQAKKFSWEKMVFKTKEVYYNK